MARAVEKHGTSLDDILESTVNLIPPAWQYPEITQGRITLDGHSYATPAFKASPYRQTADIVVKGKKRGAIEVVYTEKKQNIDEGPFLEEERHLINTLARELALIIERKHSQSEEQKLQAQLRHADRLATIGQLASGVAHELNEPLGNILGFAQLAGKCPGLPKQAGQDIEKIVKASLHAREIVRKLLLFSRQMPTRKEKTNLNDLIKEGLYFLQSRCIREGIELNYLLSEHLPEITVDPSQLKQVIVNLVVNAIQAMPAGGKLDIRTHTCDDQISIFVEDTGVGMSKAILKQIFLPFFTTKDIGEGTGLGLSVVHGIVTSHGGSIKVDSTLGIGTIFEIRLPVEGPAE
jgi:signal transduction histidine kinase